ncbi:restriction endonuclease subunit S [Nakamurella aerolata]|uniref:Restriction endonuclease subunit S n=1 Tax=Nakamurella aerolata TaxID=1656892 RepID=A0A849A9Z1_9ACTN|nr:restriction endonuclease subunit S [Nakamurella aerolata]
MSAKVFTGGGARFRSGDTLVARITPCLENGKIAAVPYLETEVGFGSTEFVVLRGDGIATDSRFVRYLAMTPEFRDHAVRNLIGSSGRQRVSADVLSQYTFPVPPLEEQERIAGVLGAFDDLIETNRRLIESLLDLAESAYVRTASSLPRVRLGDLVRLNYGKALPARDRVPGVVPVVSSAGITGTHDMALVNGPGVVVGRKGTVGTVTWVRDDFYPIDTAFYAVSELPVELTFQTLTAAGLDTLNSDSAVPGLNRDRALAQLVPDVRGEPSVRLGEALSSVMSASDDLAVETADLTRQRDELLPLLMSGKVRVRDVEATV